MYAHHTGLYVFAGDAKRIISVYITQQRMQTRVMWVRPESLVVL